MILAGLTILQETDDWLAVDKPAGMTIHNRQGEDVLSFVAGLGYPDVHAVHRLDAGTSGVILFAKSRDAARDLHEMFAARSMEKIYLAKAQVRRGEVPSVGDEGVWTWSLTKKAESRKNPRGWAGQRVPCKTQFVVLEVTDGDVRLRCEPQTGRKHQIRRHAAVAGWPLIGDYRYGPAPPAPAAELAMRLHARSLAFVDPRTGEAVCIESPMPEWALHGLTP